MNKLSCKLFKFFSALPFFLILCFLPYSVFAKQVIVKKIQIKEKPLSVSFSLTQNTPIKVIHIEKNEVLVAFRNASFKNKVKLSKNSLIKNIDIKTVRANVLAVLLTGTKAFQNIQYRFNKSDSSFVVYLESQPKFNQSKKKKTPQIEKKIALKKSQTKNKLKKTNKNLAKQTKKNKASVYIPATRKKSEYKGDISDLVLIVEKQQCKSEQINNAIVLLKKNIPKKAFQIIDNYIKQSNTDCLNQAHYLRAYAFYKSLGKDSISQLLKAERMFQDALVTFPKSTYVPFGYATIGIIQRQLNNPSSAEGYFNIVRKKYPKYKGMPEIMYNLADMYFQGKNFDKALRYYKAVFDDEFYSSSLIPASFGYGKSFFNKKQFFNALAVFKDILQTNPKILYDSEQLLLYMGNAYFSVWDSKATRENLIRTLNLFPQTKNKDIILSKIGDSYGMENNFKKAIAIYQLVRQKFPDSKGYIISSMGIARYIESYEEKIKLYNMIKTKFPEDKNANIAMMLLADLYQKNGDYKKCIQEVKTLLEKSPRGLNYEAIKLMQHAYEGMFEKQFRDNEYTKVLNTYEINHTKLDKMNSKKIHEIVGLAYLQAKLYNEAYNHLSTAYKEYKKENWPAELIFGLGISMNEIDRNDEALSILNFFLNKYPQDKNRSKAFLRTANIYLKKNKYKTAYNLFIQAYESSDNHIEKAKILSSHAKAYETKNQLKQAVILREKIITEIALASGENYDALINAYKQLGRVNMILERYVGAADSYLKALNLATNDRTKANLGFLLGEAYQKGNIIPKAKEAFEQVASNNDSVWAKLARQKLDTLKLSKNIQSS